MQDVKWGIKEGEEGAERDSNSRKIGRDCGRTVGE